MKLGAIIGETEANVEFRREADRVLAKVDDRSYELTVRENSSGFTFLNSDRRVFDCRVEQTTAGQAFDVVVGSSYYSITLIDPKRLRGAANAGAHADGVARMAAPMPGKVVRVLASVGDQVEAGAGIVVVEAMKMQNEMKSPKAGRVVAMNVEVGATVNGGEVLAVIE